MRGLAPPSVIRPGRNESSIVTSERLLEFRFRRNVSLCAASISRGLGCLTCSGSKHNIHTEDFVLKMSSSPNTLSAQIKGNQEGRKIRNKGIRNHFGKDSPEEGMWQEIVG